MGVFISAVIAAALQESVELTTVALPPVTEQVVEAPVRRVAAPAPEAVAPRRIAEGPVDAPSLGGFVGASVVVVALLGGGLWALRRFGRTSRFLGAGGPIRLLSRKSLGARQEILLVEVGPRVLVVGSTRDRLTTLGEISNPDEVAVLRTELPGRRAESERTAFQETLKEGLKGAPVVEESKAVYAGIADELAEIRKTVHAWKA